MYNQQQETSGKIPVQEWTQHDYTKWRWIEDDCPSALVDLLTTEISVQNDLSHNKTH